MAHNVKKFDRVAAFVDIHAAKHNFQLVKKLSHGQKVLCVLKANAYGHGAAKMGGYYEKWGADMLGVASTHEGVTLRQSGVSLPILIFGPTDPEKAYILARNNLCQTVFSAEYGEALHAAAERQRVKIQAHFKIDSGMHRLGFDSGKTDAEFARAADAVLRLLAGGRLLPCGVFTHFACGDGESEFDARFCAMQAERFEGVLLRLERGGACFELVHGGASGGLFNKNVPRYDMVRLGIALFGLYEGAGADICGVSADNVGRGLAPASADAENCAENAKSGVTGGGFVPVMTVLAHVAQVKELTAGERVGYGGMFTAGDGERIAVVTAGYADGVLRCLGGRGSVFGGGRRLSIVGRVSMDQMTVACGETDLAPGGYVELFGRRHTANEVARNAGTVGYEIICALSPRVERIYVSRFDL